jgi:hypothetical protein
LEAIFSNQITANQFNSIQIKANQIKANQIKSKQSKSIQFKSNQIKSIQFNSNQIKSNQNKSKQIHSTQFKSNQIQINSIQIQPNQIKSNQSKAKQSKSNQIKSKQQTLLTSIHLPFQSCHSQLKSCIEICPPRSRAHSSKVGDERSAQGRRDRARWRYDPAEALVSLFGSSGFVNFIHGQDSTSRIHHPAFELKS